MKHKNNKKIAIIGHGFVGKATDWGFNKNIDKFIFDPKYNTNYSDLYSFNPEMVFVCVPTPMSSDGSQDLSIVESTTKMLLKRCPDSIIILKSTIVPSALSKLLKISRNLIYNPEFLREKYANEDFVNSPMIIFGGDRNIAEKVSKLYLDHSRCVNKDHIFTDLLSAALIKYSINTFLATKVIFFNEIKDIFEQLDVNDSWEKIIRTISLDLRIGSSHMDVPGHDGRRGFGGACFPKDSLAFAKCAKELGCELSVLTAAIKTNNKIRSQYKTLDKRESEQNVSFDDKI